ncbi:MAG: zinc ribbon domain-containing protein [Armatimonadota bacterium]
MESDELRPMTCPHCGHENPHASAFCNACGGRLQAPVVERREGVSREAREVTGQVASEPAVEPASEAPGGEAEERVRQVQAAFEAAMERQRLAAESGGGRLWLIGCGTLAAIALGAALAVMLNVSARRSREAAQRRKEESVERSAGAPRMSDILLAEGRDEWEMPVDPIEELRPGELEQIVCFFTYEGRRMEATISVEWWHLGRRADRLDVGVRLPESGERDSFVMPVPGSLEPGMWDVKFVLDGQVIGETQVIVGEAYADRAWAPA